MSELDADELADLAPDLLRGVVRLWSTPRVT